MGTREGIGRKSLLIHGICDDEAVSEGLRIYLSTLFRSRRNDGRITLYRVYLPDTFSPKA